jgi:hypothetical protein
VSAEKFIGYYESTVKNRPRSRRAAAPAPQAKPRKKQIK